METRLNTGNKIKLELNYRIFKQNHKLVVRAKTALVFADKDSGKLIPGAHQYLEALTFQEEQSSS